MRFLEIFESSATSRSTFLFTLPELKIFIMNADREGTTIIHMGDFIQV